MKTRIAEQTVLLDALSLELEKRMHELDAYESKEGEEWRTQLRTYNALVDEHNRLIEETKKIIDVYNAQIATTNACISGTDF